MAAACRATLPLALAPMTGFITGAVNPDAVHIPLSLATGVAWYRMLRDGDVRVAAHALLLGALLTKPPGVTLLLALLIVVPVGHWLGWWSRQHATAAWRSLLLTGGDRVRGVLRVESARAAGSNAGGADVP